MRQKQFLGFLRLFRINKGKEIAAGYGEGTHKKVLSAIAQLEFRLVDLMKTI
jgi:hypothetical protein